MAILSGFRDVKPGVSYNGQMVKYIATDTKKRFHLMPFIKWGDPQNKSIAVLDGNGTITKDTTPRERADIFWLWESLKNE